MRHPETRDGEVFVTNADLEGFDQISWKTKRKGDVAYDKEGTPLGQRWPGAFPVFVQIQEIEKKYPGLTKNPIGPFRGQL